MKFLFRYTSLFAVVVCLAGCQDNSTSTSSCEYTQEKVLSSLKSSYQGIEGITLKTPYLVSNNPERATVSALHIGRTPEDYMIVAMGHSSFVNTVAYYHVLLYLDTDANPATGMPVSDTLGADYLVYQLMGFGQDFHKWTGDQIDGSWSRMSINSISTIGVYCNDSAAAITVNENTELASLFEITGVRGKLFLGENQGVDTRTISPVVDSTGEFTFDMP